MMNFFAKALVLVHTIISVMACGWAFMIFFQGRDWGFAEPRKEAVAFKPDGEPTAWNRHASDIDKSIAALNAAVKMRDQLYPEVQAALDKIRTTQPYLPRNTLYYQAEINRLQKSPDNIVVKRLKDGGLVLELLDTPAQDNEVKGITKSIKTYSADLAKLQKDVGDVEMEIQQVTTETKKLTAELTGTDEANKYTHPGLYQLIDLEFQIQLQLKREIEEIKPHARKAMEAANVMAGRRLDLEATLEKLKGAKK
jgi:hypothetical protein